MHEPNVARVLAQIRPGDVVLDVGGWARPFNRADYVIDAEPYETRGSWGLAAQGNMPERFTRGTWIRRDICDRTPFPFADKAIDYAVCSHTLEDVRDPVWVCSELIRVARHGYIEVPSRQAESARGVEPGQVGWSHHRWLVEIADGSVHFLMKYHRIHSHWRLSLPKSYLRALPEAAKVQWLFWDDGFTFGERTIHGPENIERELEAFVARTRPYPASLLLLDAGWRRGTNLGRRALWKLQRTLRSS